MFNQRSFPLCFACLFVMLLTACANAAAETPTLILSPIPTLTMTKTTAPTETLIPMATDEATATVTATPTGEAPLYRLAFSGGEADLGGETILTKTIFYVNSDGSGLEASPFSDPVEFSSHGTFLAISPDDHWLAFSAGKHRGHSDGLYLADLRAGTAVSLTTIAETFTLMGGPSWSPDSLNLVIPVIPSGAPSTLCRLHVIDVTNRQRRCLTESESSDIFPAWSPDGQWIAYYRYDTEKCGALAPASGIPGCLFARLMLIRPDGSEERVLLDQVFVNDYPEVGGAIYHAPVWAPDSQWLAVTVGETEPDIAIVNLQSGEVRLLAPSPAKDDYPAWSPDGSQILFVSERDGNAEIYAVAPDGSGLVNLTNTPAREFFPVWSPDGAKIAFISNREYGSSEIMLVYVMNRDGSEVVRVSGEYFVRFRPAWFHTPHR